LVRYTVKPLEIIKLKERLISIFHELLSENERERAKKDSHAQRPPRWCGFTVHVTINCPFACAYCYIEDMGFNFGSPRPYPLSGRELAFALLMNKAFLPGRTGSLIAIGSVSEPFIFPNKALEYLEWLGELGNPLQFSTKQYISPQLAEKIANIAHKKKISISPLVTIITLEKADILEKRAPSPEKRLDTIKNLRDAGLRPILFLRPVIPGVNVNEVSSIIEKARGAGAYGVVVGGFRVTEKIVKRLENIDLDTSEIRRRIKKLDRKQRAVPFPEKQFILKEVKKQGLIAWASTCCANSWTAEVPCPSACFINGPCTKCPNACMYPQHSPPESEILIAFEKLGLQAEIRDCRIILRNYPFRGAEFLARNLGRRDVRVHLRKIKSPSI